MEINIQQFLTAATSYVVAAIAKSDTAKSIKEKALQHFLAWTRTKAQLELEQNTKGEDIQTALQQAITAQPSLLEELKQELEKVKQAEATEKNVIKGDIKEIKGSAKIGDKNPSQNENYARKNIIEGNIQSIGGDLHLGDG